MGRGRCQRWLCSHRVSGRSPHHAPDTRPGDRAHALTTPSPVLWRSVLKPLASLRRLTPGRAIVSSGLTTPSSVLWRSVLKPLASLRRLTPGRAIVPSALTTTVTGALGDRCSGHFTPRRRHQALRSCRVPMHTVAGALAIGAQATCIAPSPDTRPRYGAQCRDHSVAGALAIGAQATCIAPSPDTPGCASVPRCRPPRCWSRYGGSPYRGRRPTRRAGPGYRDSS